MIVKFRSSDGTTRVLTARHKYFAVGQQRRRREVVWGIGLPGSRPRPGRRVIKLRCLELPTERDKHLAVRKQDRIVVVAGVNEVAGFLKLKGRCKAKLCQQEQSA